MNEEEIVNKLTENGKYCEDVCILFLLDDKVHYMKYLCDNGITGKKFETFIHKCCDVYDINCFVQTILYISFDIFQMKDVHENLESNNPIPFIKNYENKQVITINDYMFYSRDFKERFEENKRGRAR
jgi:hypothetical protein